MMRLGDAIGQIQALLGDPKGQWVKRGYILPLLNITYAAVNLNIKNASAKNLTAVVPILNVPAGTTSLYKWQNATAFAGQPVAQQNPPALLAGLFDVMEIWVKPAGVPVQRYFKIRNIGTLPHTNPSLMNSNGLGGPLYYSMKSGGWAQRHAHNLGGAHGFVAEVLGQADLGETAVGLGLENLFAH